MLIHKQWITYYKKENTRYIKKNVWTGLFLFGFIPLYLKRETYGGIK